MNLQARKNLIGKLYAGFLGFSILEQGNLRLKRAAFQGAQDLDVVCRLQFMQGLLGFGQDKTSWTKIPDAGRGGLKKARYLIADQVMAISEQYDSDSEEILKELAEEFRRGTDTLGDWLSGSQTGLFLELVRFARSAFKKMGAEQYLGISSDDLVMGEIVGITPRPKSLTRTQKTKAGVPKVRKALFVKIGHLARKEFNCAKAGPVTCLFGNFEGDPPIDWKEMPSELRGWRQNKFTLANLKNMAKKYFHREIVKLAKAFQKHYVSPPEGAEYGEFEEPFSRGSSLESQVFEILLGTSAGISTMQKIYDAFSRVEGGEVIERAAELLETHPPRPGTTSRSRSVIEISAPQDCEVDVGKRVNKKFERGVKKVKKGETVPVKKYLAWEFGVSQSTLQAMWTRALAAFDQLLDQGMRKFDSALKTKKFSQYLDQLDSDEDLLDLLARIEDIALTSRSSGGRVESDIYEYPGGPPKGSPFVQEFTTKPQRRKRAYLLGFSSRHPLARDLVLKSLKEEV